MPAEPKSWTVSERREVFLLGGLPLASAALLVAALFAGEPRIWPLAFIVSAACAYLSLLGVVPLLLVFRRLGWQGWPHFAVAGYVGVLVVWLVPVAVLGAFESLSGLRSSSGFTHAVAFLSVPGAIAALATSAFWFLCVQVKVAPRDI